MFETGNYFGAKPKVVSPIEGIKAKLGSSVTVGYEGGCGVLDAPDAAAIQRAADLAAKSDAAILFLGTNLKVEAEGRDRKDMFLPGAQQQLLEAVFKANPKTVVVLMTAGPLSVRFAKDNVPAILQAWYPGEEAGTALASVLFGDYNPAGRLPYTVYETHTDVPPDNEYDVTKGFTYLYFSGKPQFAFGHGLSYTDFKYSGLKVSPAKVAADGKVTVSVDVQNTGARAGDEVVQLYVHDVEASVKRPIKELRAFERVSLKPKEKKRVTLTLPAADLAFWSEAEHKFVFEPGKFDIMVGASSDDIRLKSVIDVR